MFDEVYDAILEQAAAGSYNGSIESSVISLFPENFGSADHPWELRTVKI